MGLVRGCTEDRPPSRMERQWAKRNSTGCRLASRMPVLGTGYGQAQTMDRILRWNDCRMLLWRLMVKYSLSQESRKPARACCFCVTAQSTISPQEAYRYGYSSKHPSSLGVLWWCPGPDLNRHDLNGREILSLLCLPISPPGQAWSAKGREGYHARRLTEAP